VFVQTPGFRRRVRTHIYRRRHLAAERILPRVKASPAPRTQQHATGQQELPSAVPGLRTSFFATSSVATAARIARPTVEQSLVDTLRQVRINYPEQGIASTPLLWDSAGPAR
jgi:hypothetical protein